jgi:hypothetical protein
MKRLKDLMNNSMRGISLAVFRFPLTVFGLSVTAIIIIRLIATEGSQDLLLQKYIFTFVVGAVLGMATQFAIERFELLLYKRLIGYLIAILLILGYFLILLPIPQISDRLMIRSFVAAFALACMVLWIPSYQSQVDFNRVALVHLKSSFTSLLYAGVLSLGTLAIVGSIDALLFDVSYKAYLYAMTVIWVVFAPIYYLSLLPRFHSRDEEEQGKLLHIETYPKFLEILVSNIAIPLICVYTLVLIAYFIKILFTLSWPSGQIGPMVLIYTIAGLVIFILASLLKNKFAAFYRKIFPKILIPIVILQLISVGIRVKSYGVTESRYYIALFGIFSILAGIMLCFNNVNRNGRLALLAALFALISIVPPLDAFTVSRNNQINRVEAILELEGMLKNESITKKENATIDTKVETTSILDYLDRSSSLSYIEWLPEGFNVNQDMKAVFGFGPSYSNFIEERQYFSVFLDTKQPLPIEGYDIMLSAFVEKDMKENASKVSEFELNGTTYQLNVGKTSEEEVVLSIKDFNGKELIATDLNTYVQDIIDNNTITKEALSPEELSIEISQTDCWLKIVFQSINYTSGSNQEAGLDYSMLVLFAISK